MKSIDKEIAGLEAAGPKFMKGLDDANIRPAIIVLAKTVRSLDRTSGRLAFVNVLLFGVAVAIGAVQLWVMLRH